MKYYSYSVKKILTECFGEDPLAGMRSRCGGVFGEEDRRNLLPLSWQYADGQTLQLFLNEKFLTGTSIEDDYIAYMYQQGDQKCVLLMFMLYEEDAPFSIHTDYACQIMKSWEAAGYRAKIVSQCIGVEEYRGSRKFRFGQHCTPGMGTYIYQLTENGGKMMLVLDMHNCWPVYFEKLIHVSAAKDICEYECLFEPAVSITSGDRDNKQILAAGLGAAADFVRENTPVRACLAEFRSTGIYHRVLLAGDKEVSIRVNERNLIAEMNISDWKNAPVIDCDPIGKTGSLIAQVPVLLAVRALDVTQLHGYAVQLTYSDGSIRNYYLKMFDEPQIPDRVIVDGRAFHERVLNSVTIKRNGICFDNGYAVAAHLLYYRSYRQLQAVPMDRTGASDILEPGYLLPLKEVQTCDHYWGDPGERYGPADALLDREGRRLTDASFRFLGWSMGGVRQISMEPTGLWGFLREDGTWLVPPVYTSAERFDNGCILASRRVNGEPGRFLITPGGRELRFDYEIDPRQFDGGLCPFNAAEEPVSAPRPGYYWDHDYEGIKPGKWGYVNPEGEIVVEPQYVYAVGFCYGGGTQGVVARLVDGKLLWGAIDTAGREVIPCRFASLYTCWGDAFAFRNEGEELYGVMDPEGNLLAEPQFEYFEAYDPEHRLITVGTHEDELGVYSIDRQAMLIPVEYDCIDYGRQLITCEMQYSGRERYFDYSGNELDFSAYDSVSEDGELLQTWKDRRYGYIKMDGTVVIPNILRGAMGSDCLALYRRGYVITGDEKSYGLATVDGREILPEKYADIIAYDGFVIASERLEGNWCVRDTLYRYDGTPILQGAYRNIRVDRKKRELRVQTPRGTAHFRIL